MMVSVMADRLDTPVPAAGRGARIAWWAGAAVLGLFVAPVTAGYTVAHLRRAPDLDWTRAWGLQLVLVAALVAGAALLVRWRHLAATNGPPKPASVRANHRLLAWTGALGGITGFATAMAVALRSNGAEHPDLLSGALPPAFAVVLAAGWGIVLPVLSWRWDRVVDEHERDAYRDGAVAGYYMVAIGAPVWWFLWRGGLAPAVDAVWMFTAMIFASGAVWMWRKYR